jgi:hypothetical protein
MSDGAWRALHKINGEEATLPAATVNFGKSSSNN